MTAQNRPIVPQDIRSLSRKMQSEQPQEAQFLHGVASVLQQQLEEFPDTTEVSYCDVLSLYGAALQGAPYSSTYLIDWANVRQLLASRECENAYTTGDYRAAVELAIEQAPLDPGTRFTAGMLYLWAGERLAALEQFRRFLEYTTEVNEFEEQYIAAAIEDPAELLAVIPARFPHVVRWASIFQTRKTRRFERYRGAFGTLQRRALDRLLQEYRQKQVPESVFRNHLIALSDFVATDTLRRTVDTTMSDYLIATGRQKIAGYYAARSRVAELERVIAWQARDRRPQDSQLALWGRDEPVALDVRETSIGWYLPEYQTLEWIELRGQEGGRKIELDQLRLFVSNDNYSWTEIPVPAGSLTFVLHRRPVCSISVSIGDFRFWKVHFASPGQKQFSNYLDRMVHVYGSSARK